MCSLASFGLARGGFVTREGGNLELEGKPFRFGGANIYWLGLDENGPPGVAYPTPFRQADALGAAAQMGMQVVRSHSLGVSTGNRLSYEPTLGVFNESALEAADNAIAVAGKLGLKLVIPLTDNYHYYHGGKHGAQGLCCDGVCYSVACIPRLPAVCRFYRLEWRGRG